MRPINVSTNAAEPPAKGRGLNGTIKIFIENYFVKMTSKERVKRAVHFERPDRIPILHSFTTGVLPELGQGLIEIFTRYPSDISLQYPENYRLETPEDQRRMKKCAWTDEWGCRWDYPGLGVAGIVNAGPFFKTWDRLNSFPLPEFEQSPEKPHDWRSRYVLQRIPEGRLFQRMFYLRGYENLLLDIMDEKEEVYILRDRLVAWMLKHLEPLLECEWIDAFVHADDWGTQTALMISPAKWREIFKPAYNKIFSKVRAAGKDLYFHSDGQILEIIPDLVETGVNILNPQFSCMDFKSLGKFRGQVCFLADIDRQYLLPFGAPAEIEKNVKDAIQFLSMPEGGMIGRAEIGPGVPRENAEAAYRTFYEYSWDCRRKNLIAAGSRIWDNSSEKWR